MYPQMLRHMKQDATSIQYEEASPAKTRECDKALHDDGWLGGEVGGNPHLVFNNPLFRATSRRKLFCPCHWRHTTREQQSFVFIIYIYI